MAVSQRPRHYRKKCVVLPYALFLSILASTPPGHFLPATLDVTIEGLRKRAGVIRACLIARAQAFPDCVGDPSSIRLTIPASGRLSFNAVPPGNYALTLFHDENANGKLDTILGIPREGFGFSRNPTVRFAAPKYDKVVIKIASGLNRITVRLQYLL